MNKIEKIIILGWIFIGVLLISTLIVSAETPLIPYSFCYQETANISTSCGGKSTGVYGYFGGNNFINPTNTHDGDFNTYGYSNFAGEGRLFINYTKPVNALNTSLWSAKGVNFTSNFSIPSNCWNEEKIRFHVRMVVSNYLYLYCLNSTNDDVLIYNIQNFTNSSYSFFYEEAMYWNMTDLLENNQSFNQDTYSNNQESFYINLSFDNDRYDLSASLMYNNTEYVVTSIDSGNNILLNKTLYVPEVTEYTNITFYWKIALTNSSGTFYYNSSFNNQTINPILFGICNATFNISYINFTILDITSKLPVNSQFKSTWYIGSTNYQNYSYQDLSETNSSFAFCFNPSNLNYTLNAIIEYDATNKAKNYYYLTNSILNNITSNITLYLLNDSLATLTELDVVDQGRKPIQDVFITIQQYDPGTDTFYTVSMAKTDYSGKDLTYLNWYDTFYKFILVKDEEIIYIANTTKISATPKEFLIFNNNNFLYDKFENIGYSLTFNNLTKNFVLTYTDPTGLVAAGCLKVIKQGTLNGTIICDSCEYSSSATIYCNILAYGNGTYIGSFYGLGSYATIVSLPIYIGSNFQDIIYDNLGNVEASFYAFMFAGLVLAFFLITPVLGILGAILGMTGAILLGFQSIDIATYLGVVIIGGIIIWILKR